MYSSSGITIDYEAVITLVLWDKKKPLLGYIAEALG